MRLMGVPVFPAADCGTREVPPFQAGARLEEGFADRTLRPVGASGFGSSVERAKRGLSRSQKRVRLLEELFRKKKQTTPQPSPPRLRGRKIIPDLKKFSNSKKATLLEKPKQSTTLSSGSLGSRVDEERSQLRDLV